MATVPVADREAAVLDPINRAAAVLAAAVVVPEAINRPAAVAALLEAVVTVAEADAIGAVSR